MLIVQALVELRVIRHLPPINDVRRHDSQLVQILRPYPPLRRALIRLRRPPQLVEQEAILLQASHGLGHVEPAKTAVAIIFHLGARQGVGCQRPHFQRGQPFVCAIEDAVAHTVFVTRYQNFNPCQQACPVRKLFRVASEQLRRFVAENVADVFRALGSAVRRRLRLETEQSMETQCNRLKARRSIAIKGRHLLSGYAIGISILPILAMPG